MNTIEPMTDRDNEIIKKELAGLRGGELQKVGIVYGCVLAVRVVKDDKPRYVYCCPGSPGYVCVSEESPGCGYPHTDFPAGMLGRIEHQTINTIEAASEYIALTTATGWRIAVIFDDKKGNAVLIDEEGLIRSCMHPDYHWQAGRTFSAAGRQPATQTSYAVVSYDTLMEHARKSERETVRRAVRQQLRKEYKRLERKLDKIEHDNQNAEASEQFRLWGELLKAHYHVLARGMSEVTVTDFFSDKNEEMTIALDPAKTPQENIKGLFHRAQKGERGRKIVAERLAETRRELEQTAEKQEQAEKLEDTEALRGLTATRPAKTQVRTAARAKKENGPRLARYLSSDGFEIIAGKNARENDYITVRIAHGTDIWMHTRNRPGSHVVIRAGRKEVPRATMLEAARVCACASKVAEGDVVEITYAQRKHVSKPKGAKPGLVLVAGGKTIGIRNEARATAQWMREHRIRESD